MRTNSIPNLQRESIEGFINVASAYLSNNQVAVKDLPAVLKTIYEAVAKGSVPENAISVVQGTGGAAADDRSVRESQEDREKQEFWSTLPRTPAVPVEDSVHHDYIVCLFDGEKRKMLKRHLRVKYRMEEDDYRRFWNLPKDYPLVAPGYAQEKRLVAVAQGLGSTIDKTPRHLRSAPSMVG